MRLGEIDLSKKVVKPKLYLCKPNKEEITMIKKVAVDLLAKIKAKIAELDHWADKPETKAIVDNLIRDTLWTELPESYDEISITTYRKEIYEYIYLRYKKIDAKFDMIGNYISKNDIACQ